MKNPIEKRFKILSLLAMQLGIWGNQMEALAEHLDANNPQAIDALNYYEDKIIAAFEEGVFSAKTTSH